MLVKGFKDITGQEFVAEVVSSEQDFIKIKNPFCFIPTENGIMPMPYVMLANGELSLKTSNLLFEPYTIQENVLNFYKQKFGGIVEPSSSLIV